MRLQTFRYLVSKVSPHIHSNKMATQRNSRRKFIKKSSMAFVAGSVLPHFSAKSYSQIIGANEKINVSVMGVNSRGKALAQNFASQENCDVIHICDVDSRAITNCLTAVAERQKAQAKGFADFRKSLESKDVDALVIAAPDHWHAQIVVDAAKAGKDIYCEKPLTLTIDEGKLIRKIQKETGRIVQVGTQQRSTFDLFTKAIALVQQGRLGKIKRIQTGEEDCV